MKGIIKKYLMLLATASCVACSLDEDPKSQFSEEEAMKSNTLVYVNTVASIYSGMGNGLMTNPLGSVFTLEEYSSDATFQPGRQGDWVDGGKWQNIFLHNFQSSVDVYNTVWNYLYKIIGLCNSSIDKISAIEGADEATKNYVYELRTVRAIYYYYLMDLYARVPLVVSSSVSTSDVSQSSRADVFNFVVSELEECLPHLSDSKSNEMGQWYGRATKGIAYMALAKCAINAPVYTTDASSKTSYQFLVGADKSGEASATDAVAQTVNKMGESVMITVDGKSRNAWETVIYCVGKLEELGYSLAPAYLDNFKASNESSPENIFVQPSDDATYLVPNFLRIYSVHYSHAVAYGGGAANGFCATVRQMKKLHYGEADQDPRLAVNYYTGTDYTEDTGGATVGDAAGGTLEYLPMDAVVDFPAGFDAHIVKCAGARFKKYPLDKTVSTFAHQNNDVVIWRYGDALLLKAEAELRSGNASAAITDLNKIRQRAGVEDLSEATYDNLLDERMRELSWEGCRRQDQIRFGTFTEPTLDRYNGVWHNASASDWLDDGEGYTCVFPIPYAALDLNKKLTQNPGY